MITREASIIMLLSFVSWAIAQLIKFIAHYIKTKKFSVRAIFSTGGMPSSHTSTVVTLVVSLGILQAREGGLDYTFVVALIFAVIVIHDATGVRQEAGKHAKILNNLLSNETEETKEQLGFVKDKNLKELLGHKPVEVVFGILFGSLIAIIGTTIFF